MNLNVTNKLVQENVIGVHATVVQNAVRGATLVIQGGQSRTEVKISDLVDFLDYQQKQLDKEREKEREQAGSDGTDVNE